jgi:protein-disulfide isomerase
MNDTNKMTIWFIAGFLVLVVAGVTVAYIVSGGAGGGPAGSGASSTFVATTVPAITAADWTQGAANAKVSVIEYGDFECPACGAYNPIIKQLVQTYGGQVQFAFRNFPLYQVHPDASISSQAAEAAGLQGKYWQMHDLLYQNQATWSVVDPSAVVAKYFDGYAQSLGLDVNKFNQDINTTAVMNKIQADVAGGTAAQIDHTPTFFVNDAQIQNPAGLDAFKQVIDQALAAAGSAAASSTPK